MKELEKIDELFSKTQIGEIENMLYGLYDISEAIRELYHDGIKPTFGKRKNIYKDQIRDKVCNGLR